MIRRPPRSTQSRSSAASDVYKRQAERVRALLDPRMHTSVAHLLGRGGKCARSPPVPVRGYIAGSQRTSQPSSLCHQTCLLYTSDDADDLLSIHLDGRSMLK